MIGECVVVGSLKSLQAVNLESPQLCDQILWKLSNVLGQHTWSGWSKWTEINSNQERTTDGSSEFSPLHACIISINCSVFLLFYSIPVYSIVYSVLLKASPTF